MNRPGRYLYVAILFFGVGVSAYGQQWPFEYWHDGKLLLESGDTLRGEVKYDLAQDLLQYKTTQRAEAFTARKVLSFEIYDKTVRRYRQFYSLPYAVSGGYKAPVFFELLEEGKITLLAREAVEYRTVSSPYAYGSYTRQVLVNYYFVLKDNGDIQPLVLKKKSDVLDRMGKQAERVEKFMKENRLNVDEKYDLVRIIDYYNSLL